MKRIILHVGMHKTGTSSIQATLAAADFSNSRFHYAQLGSPNHSRALITATSSTPHSYHLNRKRGLSPLEAGMLKEEFRNQIVSEAQRIPSKDIIFSAEGITNLSSTETKELIELLSPYGSISAVAYVRPPESLIPSALQERIKGSPQLPARCITPQACRLKYQQRFTDLEQHLGPNNISYWLFDPKTFPNHCVVSDFCQRLGIDIGPINVVRKNDSLSREALSLLFTYRRLGPGYGIGPQAIAENAALVKHLISQCSGPKLQLSSSFLEKVKEKSLDDITWIEKRLQQPFTHQRNNEETSSTVNNDADLLKYRPETGQWLAKQVNAAWRADSSPQDIANWMHQLRVQLAPTSQTSARKHVTDSQPSTNSKLLTKKEAREALLSEEHIAISPKLIIQLCKYHNVRIPLKSDDPISSTAISAAADKALRDIIRSMRLEEKTNEPTSSTQE
jgi:hypothetical protein